MFYSVVKALPRFFQLIDRYRGTVFSAPLSVMYANVLMLIFYYHVFCELH